MRSKLATLVAVALAGSGCALQNVYDTPTQKHTLKVAPHEFTPLGPVSGSECRNQVMQIFVIESPSMQGAVVDARAQRPGTDIILNKHVYSGGETVIPFFWSRRCVYLEGMAARLSKGVKR